MKIEMIELPIVVYYLGVGTDVITPVPKQFTASDTCKIEWDYVGDEKIGLNIYSSKTTESGLKDEWYVSQQIINPTNVIVHYEKPTEGGQS